MAKKSLAEQIAELSKPQNDFDIENSEIADPFAENGSDGMSSGESDSELRNEHYVAMPKSKLRKQNDKIVVDKKYTGKVTDRSALYGDNSDVPSDLAEEEESGSEEEADEEIEQQVGNNSEEDDGNSDSDSGASLRANSDDESDDDSNIDQASEDDSESDEDADVKRARIKAMMAKERGHIVSRLSEAATSDALKGYAILQQHKVFDAVIDTRLKIQKAVANSNLLPADLETLREEDLQTEHTEKYLQKAADQCYDLLDTIFKLRSNLYTKEKVVTEHVDKQPKKRTLDQYLATTHFYDDILNKNRASVLTKWLAKIQNSSGSSAMNATKFKALNQSAEQQVVNNLSDMDRLVKRTRLNRRHVKPLGIDRFLEKHSKQEANDNDNDDDENADIPSTKGQTRSLNVQELALIFDDEDFYRVLLNDLVDKKIQLNDPTSGLQFALRGAASTKLKKNVDNKASKGRKLRYHVQEPIANFETPRNSLKWADDQIDEFFASLLGQKVSMKEEDENSDAEDEDEDELVAGQDSIQLFG